MKHRVVVIAAAAVVVAATTAIPQFNSRLAFHGCLWLTISCRSLLVFQDLRFSEFPTLIWHRKITTLRRGSHLISEMDTLKRRR